VSWQLSSAAGTAVAVAPTSGSLSLGMGAQATTPLTFTAPVTEGQYTLPFQMTSSTGVPCPSPVLNVIVASAGALWPYYNNAGISDDTTGTGNFDGDGYSYSAQALAAAGVNPGSTLSVGGVTYTWPNVAAGQNDNINVGGQTITFSETAHKTTLGLLGSASSGSTGASGNLTVTYADNTTQSIPIVFGDWTEGGGTFSIVPGDTLAITTTYRDGGTTKYATTTYVYAFTASLTDATSTVTSISLPSSVSGGSMHLFDIELQ